MRTKRIFLALFVLAASFSCRMVFLYGDQKPDSNNDIVITVKIKPAPDKKKLNQKYGISVTENKSGHTTRYTLHVKEKKVLENQRGAPFQTQWVETNKKHYLVIIDDHSSSTSYTWVYSPDTGKCNRVDLRIEKDMDTLMKTSGMRFWTFSYGINSRDGSLHIGCSSRDGRKRCSRHYDVDIETGQIIRKYPAVLTDPQLPEKPEPKRKMNNHLERIPERDLSQLKTYLDKAWS